MKADLIIIGSSVGGLNAVREVLNGIGKDCIVPIVVVQHREQRAESNMDNMLRNMIRRYTTRTVEEVEDKSRLQNNHVFLAPADYHLLVEKSYLSLSTDEPVTYARPSIDVAFDSAARTLGKGVIGVVLTGASRDGADGAASIEKRGGKVIVQDPKTAENGTLPRSAIAATKNAVVLPLAEIGPYLSILSQSDGGALNVARKSR